MGVGREGRRRESLVENITSLKGSSWEGLKSVPLGQINKRRGCPMSPSPLSLSCQPASKPASQPVSLSSPPLEFIMKIYHHHHHHYSRVKIATCTPSSPAITTTHSLPPLTLITTTTTTPHFCSLMNWGHIHYSFHTLTLSLIFPEFYQASELQRTSSFLPYV